MSTYLCVPFCVCLHEYLSTYGDVVERAREMEMEREREREIEIAMEM